MRNKHFFRTGILLCMWVWLWAAPVQAAVWTVEREWTAQEEQAFSDWFRKISARAWKSVDQMLKNAEYNSLYTEEDSKLRFYADCGDLPYTVRAYYAYKRRLPYLFNHVGGTGGDIRYSRRMRTVKTFDNLTFQGSLSRFFQENSYTHSGNFRTSPERTDSFTYPVAINRQGIRPGVVFYDPNGHVALVSEVNPNGVIYLLDAHPDQSITRIRFGPKLDYRHPENAGGFKYFRRVFVQDGKVVWETDNSRLPFYSDEQYQFKDYYRQISQRLRGAQRVYPLQELENYMVQDTHQELLDRVESVALGWDIGQARAISISSNIYAAEGDWENYSTPSRDMRLRLSYLGIVDKVRELLAIYTQDRGAVDTQAQSLEELGAQLQHRVAALLDSLTITYRNSTGQPVKLTMKQIEERLFALSFDPNHPPELRWGATGQELATAPASPARYRAGYEEQQSWRNRLEKKEGAMRPNDADNPRQPPPHDLIKLIDAAIRDAAKGEFHSPAPPVATRQRPPERETVSREAPAPGRDQPVYRYQPPSRPPRPPARRPLLPARRPPPRRY